LIRYFEDYPEEKVQQFLKNFPDEFAYRHWDGSRISIQEGKCIAWKD
jgi:hypothetical protein